MKAIIIFIVLLFNFQLLFGATFVVTSKNDSGLGTIREAITLANANGSTIKDLITFNLPGSTATDVTIALFTELPKLTPNITIDGTLQPFSSLNSPSIKIIIVRSAPEYFNGLCIENSNDIEIYGLSFKNFKSDPLGTIENKKGAIFLFNVFNLIIGAPNKQNCFANNYTGIISPYVFLPKYNITNIKISSNIFGLTENGLAVSANESAIDISFIKDGIIGGDSAIEGNLISGNTSNGIILAAAEGNVKISHNKIGVNVNQGLITTLLAKGISVNGVSCKPLIAENVIVGQLTAIFIDYVNAGFSILNNRIGTGLLSTENFGNDMGIHIKFSEADVIGENNIIAYNKTAVFIEISYPITIRKNSIYCNGKSIEFSNLPIGKVVSPSKIDVITTNSASGVYLPNSTVELFYDDECPDCQGKIWLATVATDAAGNWQYNGTFIGGLTSTGTNADGATSSFSKPVINDVSRKITDVFCGSSKGSIKGILTSDASVFTWYNAAGQIVGTSLDLINMPPGNYTLGFGQPGGCNEVSAIYTIRNTNINYKIKTSTVSPASCSKNNGSVLVNSYETQKPVLFSWADENGVVVGTGESLNAVKAGKYTLTASNGNDCTNIAGSVVVTEAPLPLINLTRMLKYVTCDGKFINAAGIVVTGTTQPFTYKWIDDNGNSVSSDLAIKGIVPAIYTLTITDKYGCLVSSNGIDFNNLPVQTLKIPNTITPNGDGINDTWKIEGAIYYPNAEFKIFNRNGSLVYYSKGYNKDFDGFVNGKSLAIGTYYYIIDLKANCGLLNGSLTILK